MNVNNTYFCFIFVEYGNFHYGEPSVFLEHNTKPQELIKKVITDKFLETYVATTSAQGEVDEEFTRRVWVAILKE